MDAISAVSVKARTFKLLSKADRPIDSNSVEALPVADVGSKKP